MINLQDDRKNVDVCIFVRKKYEKIQILNHKAAFINFVCIFVRKKNMKKFKF